MKKPGIIFTLSAYRGLLFFAVIILLCSCDDSQDKSKVDAYIGGEILNPTSKFLLLKRNGIVLDSIYLDAENRFNIKIENSDQGLYVLSHKPESQNIYITPGDSLLMRANTLAFDESLHFSGSGQAANNFMTDMFLEDEKSSDFLLSFHDYTPSNFLRKVDSIKRQRLNTLEEKSQQKNFSQDFTVLMEEIIKYENNDLKERYTFLVNKYHKPYSRQFPENFHDYRNDVDFNNIALQCAPAYKRFLENYLINYSLSWCANSDLDTDDCYNLTNAENVKVRIKKGAELIQTPTIRRTLLKKIAIRGIVMAKSREEIFSIIQTLKDFDISDEDLAELEELGTIQLAFLPGTTLENNEKLLNLQGELVNTKSVITKPTVIYLWSVFRDNYTKEHETIEEYRKKYPEIDFIGVNTDIDDEPAWRVAVRENDLNPKYQYQIGPTPINSEYFQYYLEKLLFLNPSSEVIKGNVYLSSPEFESKLLEFLNQ